MKKVCVVCVAAAAYALYGSGRGKVATVTGTASRLSGFTANKVEVYNAGTDLVYAAANCTTGQFAVLFGVSNAIPIRGSAAWTFDCAGRASIDSVCLRTDGATNVCYVSTF